VILFSDLRSLALAGALLAAASAAPAHEHAPRVLSPHNADAYSMKTFAEYPRWRDLSGDAKVFEIFKYLVDRRTGIYPMGLGAWEGKDVAYDFGYIRDPVKMINVYSLGYCDMMGPTAAGIMKDMGIGPSRTLNLPGWGHVVAEVFYDGKWHYLDLDCRAVFRREDGTLASMEEAKKDDSLWKGPNSPTFFPLDNLPNTRKVYGTTPVHVRHGVNMGGHTMDYVLRRGESFVRWWKPKGDRWNHHESYHRKPELRAILEREPRGPKCKHVGWSVHNRGNGRFLYRPDLTEGSGDFEDGVTDARNVRPGAQGLVLRDAEEGYAVFEVRSPYVIVPLVEKLETAEDDREASVVRLEGAGTTASVSVDNGLTWKDLGSAPEIDLTGHVAGRYGYLLKLGLKGEGAVVRSLEIATWVQVHPASLPSLRKGRNEMRYVTGDHHGLQSHVLEIRTNGSLREDFLKHCSEPPADFDPARTSSRARGTFVAKVQAPPGMKVAWFSGGGAFTAHQGADSPKTKNTMAWAANEPRDFKEFYRADVPAGNAHWHYNADVEVKLDAPAPTIYLRYVGDPGVNNLRIYAHCVEERPPAAAPVTITHAWKERGELRKKSVTLEKPGPYEVACDDDPEDERIELSIPSSRK
jgi:hypothetical protein